jgi:hypothetical protein
MRSLIPKRVTRNVLQGEETMTSRAVTVGIAFMMLGAAVFGGESAAGLSHTQFEQALRNISTGPNYVLVRIVDKTKRDAGAELMCLEAMSLVMRLQGEHGFTHVDGPFEQAIQFALDQKDRTYEFSNRAPERSYTDAMLQEVRQFLADKDEAEIRGLARDQQSALYKLCSKEPGSLPRYFPAIGHVLSERGVLCGRSCKPGLLYVQQTKHNK